MPDTWDFPNTAHIVKPKLGTSDALLCFTTAYSIKLQKIFPKRDCTQRQLNRLLFTLIAQCVMTQSHPQTSQ